MHPGFLVTRRLVIQLPILLQVGQGARPQLVQLPSLLNPNLARMPPGQEDGEAAYRRVLGLHTPIAKYLYLRAIGVDNPAAYYHILLTHTAEILPFIYTPTVGEACQKYHTLPLQTQGLYISLEDKGRIFQKLRAWPNQSIRVIVITDGERILGLGDLGANGMGITEGKIALYTAAAGINPQLCLPMALDMGTNNAALLNDPAYKGLRRKRATEAEFDEVTAELVDALKRWQPHLLLQFEDFGNHNAFRLLDQYRSRLCCFNDDIQGTACVALAALLSALRAVEPGGAALADQTILFLGAGEAGTGIGNLIAKEVARATGCSLAAARRRCVFLDSRGLVCSSRADLQPHKRDFAHDLPWQPDLISAVTALKPTVLIGVSTVPGAFNEEVVRTMTRLMPGQQRPVIFPMSNPTSKSECTFEQAYRWTGGRVLFASGSPYPPLTTPSGATITPAQANNAYVFPAIGHAAILTNARSITDESFLVTAEKLGAMTSSSSAARGDLFPPFSRITEVSTLVIAAVAQEMVASGNGSAPQDMHGMSWAQYVSSKMWSAPQISAL